MSSEREASLNATEESCTTVVVLDSLNSPKDVSKSPLVVSSAVSNYPKISLRMNEFGIYELVPDDSKVVAEPIPISTKPGGGVERERYLKQRFPSVSMCKSDIVCCKQCDGYGMADDFIDKNFCSEKCRKLGQARASLAKSLANVVKVTVKRKSAAAAAEAAAEAVSDRSAISGDPLKEAEARVPKSFSWSKYLERRKAQAAPEKLFPGRFPEVKNGFRPGMKLEAIDPEHQSLFCVMTVAEVQGYRLRLHFDGYSDSHDVWVNADSDHLFPCGWCEKNGQKLRPPKNYLQVQRPFNWTHYLKSTGSSAAPRSLFSSIHNDCLLPSAFRVNMKLEAVDRRHSSHTLCVATVANVIGSRFLIHFDGWDSIYDYWADPSCPYVHPVGWSQEHHMPLTPPCDFDLADGEFRWDAYLAKTASTSVPPRAFKPRSPLGFKTGMKLECVDPLNPQLIRVATVASVKGYRLKIHFDGWSSDYDFWTDDNWPDLHPTSWCSKSGHPLQPPLSSAEKEPSTNRCPTVGCEGIGHIEGAKFASHNTLENCPYYSLNLHRESPVYPDRLSGEDIDVILATDADETRRVKPATDAPKSSQAASDCGDPTPATLPASPPPPGLGVEPSPSSAESSPQLVPPPQPLSKLAEESCDAVGAEEMPAAASSSDSESRNSKIKVEEEFDAKAREESPVVSDAALDDSQEDPTPPKKKLKVSYFTGKSAATPASKEKVERVDKEKNGATVQIKAEVVDGDQQWPEETAQPADSADPAPGLVCSSNNYLQMSRSILEDYSLTNTNLTTPLCWSKHATLLQNLVGDETCIAVTKWSPEQVNEFISKFGTSSAQLDKFKEEQIDGEALLYLSQNDLVDILGVKLGPAIKIRNALLLIKEKELSSLSGAE